MADLIAAMPADQRNLGVRHLPVRAVDALQLPRALDDLQHTLDMRFRELTTRGVGRQHAANAQGAGADKRSAFALFAEAVVLELSEHHVSEAIVDLRGIDILRTEP